MDSHLDLINVNNLKLYLDILPVDVLVLNFYEPEEVIKTCRSSKDFNDKYCQDPNNEFWDKMIRHHLKMSSFDINTHGSYKYQYEQIYNIMKKYKSGADIVGRPSDNSLTHDATILIKYQMNVKMHQFLSVIDKYLTVAKLDWLNKLLIEAARYGNKYAFSYLRSRGANNFAEAFEVAVDNNQEEMAKLIQDKYL